MPLLSCRVGFDPEEPAGIVVHVSQNTTPTVVVTTHDILSQGIEHTPTVAYSHLSSRDTYPSSEVVEFIVNPEHIGVTTT